ncbi:glutathione S-transferase family protein [Palleronia caenipelagi]|uniref:Glutathione S-transferase family protein n=1 Tax=Palleronia caenipelagi TaxID=2489174 RepID=A0A547PM87_9RHOB|nr:glutathione S-transferase family protein [Palleronia caenipelagi]TRD15255.1 glutathione S-transferase family protein [Palleronia caenipelagi]
MGLLQDGKWVDRWHDTKSTGGHFKRKPSQFRNWVTADGAPGPTGTGGFKAEPGRYHLYVSLACPWAHRTLIFRVLKGLEEIVSLSVVHWHMAENGWTFADGDGVIPDPILGAEFMHQIYTAADPHYSGRVTVPVLWDKKTGTIVSNESAEIIRMFNSAFDGVGATPGDFYPPELRAEINAINTCSYSNINNGVYKAGFATTQTAYEEAVTALFDIFEWYENRLSQSRYLIGDTLTEADWRLWTTLVRFDPVYFGHFKCNLRRIADYPNLSNYLRDLYQHPGIAATVDMDHIKRHYYGSHETINPTGIIPVGPVLDYDAPHNRDRF